MTNNKLIRIFAALALCTAAVTGCGDDDSQSQRKYRSVPKPEYTREAPDEWAGLEDEHLPVVTFDPDSDPDITVRVNLKNPGRDHYIEKIGIMDGDKKTLAVKEFRKFEKIYMAQFSSAKLPRDKKGLKVFVKCSLHDLWTEPLKLP
jgi:desulfoferrodoxin (superoxide reductase-like protein)